MGSKSLYVLFCLFFAEKSSNKYSFNKILRISWNNISIFVIYYINRSRKCNLIEKCDMKSLLNGCIEI